MIKSTATELLPHVQVWTNCLITLQELLPQSSYNTWMTPIVPVGLDGKTLILQVPSMFFRDHIEENFLSQLGTALFKELGEDADLAYSVIVDQSIKGVNLKSQKNQKPAFNPFENRSQFGDYGGNLNLDYNFETFVQADCNKLAYAAGVKISEKPGTAGFNPLMVYGGVGLGKTHLVQAIGNQIRANYPEKRVVYVTTEQFISQFVEALRDDLAGQFMNFYMNIDVLIIDDIQFLTGKTQTQEQFFNIFNRLHQNNKQIIMTSDCAPKDLKGMHERLTTRFKWGLTADLQAPGFETRLAILKKKIEADGYEIEPEILEYLASTVDTNVRELIGVLISIMARNVMMERIDLDMVKQVIANVVMDVDEEINIGSITRMVSEYYMIPEEALKATSRKRDIVIPRQVAMYLSREFTHSSLKMIGDFFGGKDHTTVMHAVNNIKNQLANDVDLKQAIATLQKRLENR